MFEDILKIIPWIAVVSLPLGYWKQAFHIYKHKETRDLDLGAFILFLVSYISLAIEAYSIASKVFLWKNLLVIVPTVIIILQILYYKGSTWKEYDKIKENQKNNKNLNKRINIKASNSSKEEENK